jgi:hypothetical protein
MPLHAKTSPFAIEHAYESQPRVSAWSKSSGELLTNVSAINLAGETGWKPILLCSGVLKLFHHFDE